MSALPKIRFGIAAAGLSCLFAGYGVAQEQNVREQEDATIEEPASQDQSFEQTGRPTTQRRDSTDNPRGNQAHAGAQHQDVQRYVASCLLTKNQAEVEMAEFAQQKAQTPEVKEFAEKMAQDHGKLVQMLQKMTGAQAGTRDRLQTSERTQPAANPANRDVAGQNSNELNAANHSTDKNSAVSQLIAMDKQITERCTQMARDELEKKQGVEFDKCYITSQIGGHMHMLAALEVVQQNGPEQLQQVAQQAQPTVQKHLEHAKQIMKQLEGDKATANRAARQPTQPQR